MLNISEPPSSGQHLNNTPNEFEAQQNSDILHVFSVLHKGLLFEHNVVRWVEKVDNTEEPSSHAWL